MRYCGCMENTFNTAKIWITEPIEMSLADAMAANLMADTLIRTQDGMVLRKIYGKCHFEALTSRVNGTPLGRNP